MFEHIKKERGITLVALVITVIIMLILAGVALSFITGEEGLFARTNHAASLYKDASQKEADKVGNIANKLNKYSGGQVGTLITELAKKGELKVGDYIDYNAGNWTAEDLAKITTSGGKLNGTTTVTKALPTKQGEFGGFEIEDSKNENSTPFNASFTPRTEGWRIWDIDEITGEVTIIHAGHPETYYHDKGYSKESINILRNRDCSMYENEYAESGKAHFLMGWEAAEWYTENCDKETNYELEGYDEDIDEDQSKGERSLYNQKFVSNSVIEVLENGSYYFLASDASTTDLFLVNPNSHNVLYNRYVAHGVRPLVSLKSNILLELGEQTEGEWNKWKIVGKVN